MTALHSLRLMALLVTMLTVVSPLPAAAQGATGAAKLDLLLSARASQLTGRSRVIVQFRDAVDVRAITENRGAIGRAIATQRAQVAEVDNAMLSRLAADPRVARVMLDRPVFPTLERTAVATGTTIVRDEQNALTGRGVGVAVIDSGITRWHEDLDRPVALGRPGPVVHFKDFTRSATSNLWVPDVPDDPFGHGSHVAGIVAGNGYHSHGARRGIAPGAHLVGLRVLDPQGHGYVSDVIAAIDYAVAIRRTYNIRVINLSIGAGVFESYLLDPLTLAARRAVDAGIVVVAASGNLGLHDAGHTQYGGITSPANAPWVLTVGAVSHRGTVARSDDSVAPFSSRGPTWIDFSAKPDLVAPGVGVESVADPQSALSLTHAGYLLDGTRRSRFHPYLSLSGTSMAAPVVTGTIALLLEANPALTPNAVKAILQYTAQVRPGEPMLAQGAGLLNTPGAVRLARFFARPQLNVGTMEDVIAGEAIPWARHLIWGNYRVRGGVPLPGSSAWGRHVVWGSIATPAGTPIVWGAANVTNIVWSTDDQLNVVWGTRGLDNVIWGTALLDNVIWGTAYVDNVVRGTWLHDNVIWGAGSHDAITWSPRDGNLVSSTPARGNIVWSTVTLDNIVWSTGAIENVVWGGACGHRNCRGTLWGAQRGGAAIGVVTADNIVWSTAAGENIVWSTAEGENIVWSTATGENIVWSTVAADNIVWSTALRENIVWSTVSADNIVWSTATGENIVWSTITGDNIVWSTVAGENIVWSTNARDNIVWSTGRVEQVRW